MELLGCSMCFRAGAVTEDTDIEISVDTNPENLPEDCIPVSPILHCRPSMKFKKRILVEMELSCILQKGQRIELLCKKSGSGASWKRVETQIRILEDSSAARFYLDHFCSYVFSFKNFFKRFLGLGTISHRFTNDVYMKKDTGLIASVFSKNKKMEADANLSLTEKQFISILPRPEEIKVQKSECLILKMVVNEPENTKVKAKSSRRITINEDFLDSRQGTTRYFRLIPKLEKEVECNIDIDYEIQRIRKDGTSYPNSTKTVLDSVWPITVKSLSKYFDCFFPLFSAQFPFYVSTFLSQLQPHTVVFPKFLKTHFHHSLVQLHLFSINISFVFAEREGSNISLEIKSEVNNVKAGKYLRDNAKAIIKEEEGTMQIS